MNTSTINKTPKIIGLRSTIFLNTSIGYNATNENRFKKFLPDGEPKNILISNAQSYSIGGSFGPTLNNSWILEDKKLGYNFVFTPNKVDIIETKQTKKNVDIETFIKFTIKVFQEILIQEIYASRLAFSPTVIYEPEDGYNNEDLWKIILKDTSISGNQLKDINIQYLLNSIWNEDGQEVTINFLHQWGDAYKTDTRNDRIVKCVSLTLDINTVPISGQTFSIKFMEKFFNKAISWTDELLSNY